MLPKKAKRTTTWSDKYSQEFGFIEKVKGEPEKAFCKICSTTITISHEGRAAIVNHSKTKRHQDGINAGNSSKKVTTFFKQADNFSDLQIAAKEAAFAFHTAKHNISLKSNDCTSNLVKCCFEPKFQLARTKTEAVIKKVIAPYIQKISGSILENSNFISILTDTSNHGNIKMLPILIRTFHPTLGVQLKLMSINSIPNEKSETIEREIFKNEFKDKIFSFAADNTNLNFGGVDRNGENNVYRKLQKSFNRKIFGLGCSAHIIHNSIGSACENLPIDIENIIYKIHKHFKLFTTRTTAFKKLCEEIDVIFKPTKSHTSTRFLSLSPAIDRVIELFDALKDYFKAINKCPPILAEFFALKSNKFWLHFLSNQMKSVNETILRVENSRISAFEIAIEVQAFKEKTKNRQQLVYMPFNARQEFNNFKKDLQEAIKNIVSDFYSCIVEYLDLWKKSTDGIEIFSWILLYKMPEWSLVEKSCDYLQQRFGEEITNIIYFDHIFDEIQQISTFVETKKSSWIEKKESAENIWIEIFSNFREDGIQVVNLEKLVELVLSLPGTSTEVERIFSLVKALWTDQKNSFHLDTIFSFISIQYNCEMSCVEFFKEIKKEHNILKQVMTQEKYQN